MKLKHHAARQHFSAGILHFVNEIIEDAQSLVNRCRETSFFNFDHLANIIRLFGKLRIRFPRLIDNHLSYIIEECIFYTDQPAMACSPSKKPPQDISSAFVGWKDSIGNHHCRTSDMIGNNPYGNVGRFCRTILNSSFLADIIQNVPDGINFKKIVYILHHTGQSLQSHTGVDVFLLQLGIGTIFLFIKLCKHKIPNLYVSVAVTPHLTISLTTAFISASVKVYL